MDLIGTGLASLGFWLFLAVVVVAQVWRKVTMRREALATIRLAIEKGHPLDQALIDRLLQTGTDSLSRPAAVFLALGLGFPVMGYFISRNDAEALNPFIGIGALFLMMGLAFGALWALSRKSTPAGRDRFTA